MNQKEFSLDEIEIFKTQEKNTLLFIYTSQELLNNSDLQFKILIDEKLKISEKLETIIFGSKIMNKAVNEGNPLISFKIILNLLIQILITRFS